MSKHSPPARLFENPLGSGSTMAAAGGENAKVSPACACRTALSVWPRYTGRKPTASAVKNKIKRYIDRAYESEAIPDARHPPRRVFAHMRPRAGGRERYASRSTRSS